MSTLTLAQVTDTDCLRSGRPLVLGRMPGKYVTGAAVILRRILYRWALPKGVLAQYIDPAALVWGESLSLVEGATLSDRQLLGLRRRLEVAAEEEDFVQSASAPLDFTAGVLTVPGAILLADGLTYPLEVSISSAGAALDALGA